MSNGYDEELSIDRVDVNSAVRINAIGGLIMAIPGVKDYSGLTLNGTSANIALAATEIPIKGTVTVL
jgi:uncharacterized phage protein gp47/JayE